MYGVIADRTLDVRIPVAICTGLLYNAYNEKTFRRGAVILMGVKFNRQYEEIIEELTDALLDIEGCHEFFEMEEDQWIALKPRERRELLRTLSDDLFYGLGTESFIELGDSMITWHRQSHAITVSYPAKPLRTVPLI